MSCPTSCASAGSPAGCAPCRSPPPRAFEVSSHLYPEVAAHLLRITETAHWLERQNWADPILAEPFELRRRNVVVPDKPGCGIEWNEDAVKHYDPD